LLAERTVAPTVPDVTNGLTSGAYVTTFSVTSKVVYRTLFTTQVTCDSKVTILAIFYSCLLCHTHTYTQCIPIQKL